MGMSRFGSAQATLAVTLAAFAFPVLSVPVAVAAEIEEIVVTATKRDELLQDAPVSISVLSVGTLENAEIYDLFDVSRRVASLNVAQSTGPLSESLYVRRVGNLGNIPNFESAVGVFIDGAFRSRVGASLGDLYDVQQIEIVRGPQSTLHGKNTTAGLISITTNPPADEFALQGKLTTGIIDSVNSPRLWRFEGVVNAPLTSRVAVRAGGVIYDHDETLINLFNDEHSQDATRYSARAQASYSAQDSLSARLIANRYRVDSAKTGDFVLFAGNAIQGINAGFGVPCPDHDLDDRFFCRNAASVFDLTANDVTLTIKGDVGTRTLHSISSFEDYDSSRDFDADQLNIDVVRIVDRQRGSGFSQELRLVSGNDTAAWLFGAFYLDSDFTRGDTVQPTAILGADAPNLEILPGVPAGSPGDEGYFYSITDTRHFSVFGSVDWRVSDAMSVRTGLRWQQEDKSMTAVNTANHAEPTAITLLLMPTFADASLARDTRGFSWELSGRYRWSESLMTYLLFSRGFKSGGYNAGFGATPPSSREFGDEKVDSVELGLKSMLVNERVRFNAALFAARYRDFQSAGWVSLRFLVNNAERVNVHGMEIDLQAVISEHFTTAASFSWVDARYDRYTNGSCYFNRPADNDDASACDLSGRTLPLAPRAEVALDLEYERPLASATLFGRVDWSWTSEYPSNSSLDPRHVQQAHALLDARIGFRFERIEIFAWINNAGDELVVVREGPSNLFPRDPAYGRALALPRAFGLTVTARL